MKVIEKIPVSQILVLLSRCRMDNCERSPEMKFRINASDDTEINRLFTRF
jgi:hypothetical protein